MKHPYDPKIKEKMFEDPSYVYMGSTAYNKDKDLIIVHDLQVTIKNQHFQQKAALNFFPRILGDCTAPRHCRQTLTYLV